MILLVHQHGEVLSRVLKKDIEMELKPMRCTEALWEMAEKHPEELICWVEESCLADLNITGFEEVFQHDLIMASYAVKSHFLPETIGYVDQLPFINLKPSVRYPTWRMSSDVGGIKGKTLLSFKEVLYKEKNFHHLLNSIAKLGQQNGLFCYSDPGLIATAPKAVIIAKADNKALFSFVYQHYKTIWSFLLFFCLVKYEKRFPLISLLSSFTKSKHFQKDVNLSAINSPPEIVYNKTTPLIDVIIPTLGRSDYLKKVVEDLSHQSILPNRVIIVEQQPDIHSPSEIEDFLAKNWPFKIIHIFTHKTGACMARNMALEKVESEWIFFADDDIRLEKDVLNNTLEEARRFQVGCVNINCKQPGEDTIFHKVKQWGSFGSGTSIVKSHFAKRCSFPIIYEYGYGEDTDFGMQLRNIGCDIIYHPEVSILHLKAPGGGLRQKPILEWEKEELQPKPSPTLMAFAFRFYTPQQLTGYKVSLFLKYYFKQKELNPIKYIRLMKKRWTQSEKWATILLKHPH